MSADRVSVSVSISLMKGFMVDSSNCELLTSLKRATLPELHPKSLVYGDVADAYRSQIESRQVQAVSRADAALPASCSGKATTLH